MLKIVTSEVELPGKSPDIGVVGNDPITSTIVPGAEYALFTHSDSVVLYGPNGEKKAGVRKKIGDVQAAFIRGMTRILVRSGIPTSLTLVPREKVIGRTETLESNTYHAVTNKTPSLVFEITFDAKSGNVSAELILQDENGTVLGRIGEAVLKEACKGKESSVAIAMLANHSEELLLQYAGAAKFAKTTACAIRDFWTLQGYYRLDGVRLGVGIQDNGSLMIPDAIKIYDCYLKSHTGLPVGRYLYEGIRASSKLKMGEALVNVQEDANIFAGIADTEM